MLGTRLHTTRVIPVVHACDTLLLWLWFVLVMEGDHAFELIARDTRRPSFLVMVRFKCKATSLGSATPFATKSTRGVHGTHIKCT